MVWGCTGSYSWHLLNRLCYGLRRITSSNLAAARRANCTSASSRAKTPPRRISWSWCPAQPFLATPNLPSMGALNMLVNHQTMVGKNYWRLTSPWSWNLLHFILKQFDFMIFHDCYAIAFSFHVRYVRYVRRPPTRTASRRDSRCALRTISGLETFQVPRCWHRGHHRSPHGLKRLTQVPLKRPRIRIGSERAQNVFGGT